MITQRNIKFNKAIQPWGKNNQDVVFLKGTFEQSWQVECPRKDFTPANQKKLKAFITSKLNDTVKEMVK